MVAAADLTLNQITLALKEAGDTWLADVAFRKARSFASTKTPFTARSLACLLVSWPTKRALSLSLSSKLCSRLNPLCTLLHTDQWLECEMLRAQLELAMPTSEINKLCVCVCMARCLLLVKGFFVCVSVPSTHTPTSHETVHRSQRHLLWAADNAAVTCASFKFLCCVCVCVFVSEYSLVCMQT